MKIYLFTVLIVLKACNISFMTTGFLFEDDTCWDVFTCEVEENIEIPPCYCDDDCLYYMDCCKEYLGQLNHTKVLVDNYSELLTESCEPLLTNPLETENVGAFMITQCSDEKCNVSRNDFDSFLPVSSKTKTYRNANCARCNDVHDFEYWRVQFELVSGDLSWLTSPDGWMNQFFNVSQAPFSRYIFHPPLAFIPRFCYPVISNDGLAMPIQNISQDIDIYQAAVASEICFKIFRNIDVCLAQGCCIKNELHRCHDLDLPDYPHYGESSEEYIKNVGIKPLQILFIPSKADMHKRAEKEEDFTLKIRYKEMLLLIRLNKIRIKECQKCSNDEIQQLTKTGIGRCFVALDLTLGRTKYRPILNRQSFKSYELKGNTSTTEQGIFMLGIATPTVTLSPSDFHLMMKWKMSFSFHDTKSGFESFGTVLFLNDEIIQLKYNTNRRAIVSESEFRLQVKDSVENCENISITADEENLIIECVKEGGQIINAAIASVEENVWNLFFFIVYVELM